VKKLKFDDEGTQPTEEKIKEDKDDKPTKKTGKRRKQIARKGFHTDHDRDESKELDDPVPERCIPGASTPEEVKRMQNVPYASAVDSIMYVTDRDDTKSKTGYVFILNGGAVDWKSSKQSTTAMSAIEAEYIAASKAVWIRKFISGLGAKHYHMRYHYVRESIALGEIRFFKVHTDDNLADPFTKALSKPKLTQYARSMGLHLASSFM
ncbi:hypothetical protein Tco_0034492, partial [Tanacetum coccineum]